MTRQSLCASMAANPRNWRKVVQAGAAAAVLHAAAPAGAATIWDHAHADATNSGFVDVRTAPAVTPAATVSGIGTFAPGAGPVIGPDGTVYLGNRQGVLRALHPDGTPKWQRSLSPPANQQILSSPVVDTDGSLYVVSTLNYKDAGVSPAMYHHETRLYHFDPGAALLWVVRLPSPLPGGSTTADYGIAGAPNIWRVGNDAAIIVPAIYTLSDAGFSALLAFSTNGAFIDAKFLSRTAGALHTDLPPYPGVSFCPPQHAALPQDRLPRGIKLPLPSAAVFTFPGGASAWIMGVGLDETLGYNFSPASGFTQLFRNDRSGDEILSSPLVLPDQHTVAVIDQLDFNASCERFDDAGGRATFARPNATPVSDAVFSQGAGAMPARTADGRIVITHSFGMEILQGSAVVSHIDYAAESIAPPAVSRNHIFVSTASSLRTYDAHSLAKLAEFDWNGGGQNGPVIGPSGKLYALASNVLFIWPEPKCTIAALCLPLPPPVSVPIGGLGVAGTSAVAHF